MGKAAICILGIALVVVSCGIYPFGKKADRSQPPAGDDIITILKKLEFEENYQELRRRGLRFLEENKDSGYSGRVRLMVGSANLELGLLSEADSILKPLLEGEDPENAVEALLMLAEVSRYRGRYAKSARRLLEVLSRDVSESVKRKARGMLTEVSGMVPEEQLDRISTQYSSSRGIDIILGEWLALARATGDTEAVEQIKKRMDKLYQQGLIEEGYFEEGITIPFSPREKKEKGLIRVGVLCPISGRFKALGDQFIRGISIALEEARGEGVDNIEVIVGNSRANSLKSHFITEKLIQNEGVSGVIGGISRSATVAAAQTSSFLGTVFISPIAINESISDIGDCVFQYSSGHETEVIAVARMASLEMDMERFAFLGPDNISSRAMERIFRAEVERMGGVLCVSRFYPEGATDFQEDIKAIRDNNPRALFISSDLEDLVLILPQFTFHEFGVQLLGMSAWNSEKLLISVGRDIEGAIFPVIDRSRELEKEFIGAVTMLDKPAKEVNPFVLGGYNGLKTFIRAVRISSRDGANPGQAGYFPGYRELCRALKDIFARRRHPYIDFVSSGGITFYTVRNKQFVKFGTLDLTKGNGS